MAQIVTDAINLWLFVICEQNLAPRCLRGKHKTHLPIGLADPVELSLCQREVTVHFSQNHIK
jgi:hypothetical protein